MSVITCEVKGNKTVITFDHSGEGTMSSTGKSKIIASSNGFMPIPGTDLKVNVTAIRKV